MKKGFTLIEMLGIVVILGLILVFSVPTVINSLNSQDEKEYEVFKSTIKMAAESYCQKKSCENVEYITIGSLIDEGYIKDYFINPQTKEIVNVEDKVIITEDEQGNVLYEFQRS